MRTVQFLRFRLPPGREERLLETHRAAAESCRASYATFQAAFLVSLEDGDWLDVSFWDSDVDASGRSEPPPPDARADFISQLDELLGDENGLLVNSLIAPSFRSD